MVGDTFTCLQSSVMASDDLAYAIKISPHGAALLCSAAGIDPPVWEDREWAEPLVQSQSWGLTRKSLYEIITDDDIVSRRPLLCARCGETITAAQFMEMRSQSKRKGLPDPGATLVATHQECVSD